MNIVNIVWLSSFCRNYYAAQLMLVEEPATVSGAKKSYQSRIIGS